MADTYHNATDFGLIEPASAPDNILPISLPLYLVTNKAWDAWYKAAADNHQRWIDAQGFEPKPGRAITLPDSDGNLTGAVAIISNKPIWDAASIANGLPVQTWQIDNDSADAFDDSFLLGWALAHYRYTTYRDKPAPARASLMLPADTDTARILGLASGTFLGRDMINMPPNKMNPGGLEDTARTLSKTYKAKITVISGAKLASGFPAIDCVGRAAECPPRLIDMRWGKTGPKITLIGKGITFDSGGLDLKPSKAMEMMKKDMGGSAIALGLANALMHANVPIQLRVLVPAAENAVSERSMRPLDVIDTRAELKVEIGNTDAEGRLVLADAITYAREDTPDFMIDFATLTGAARVALGTELPALFANDDAVARSIIDASNKAKDPLWQLPLFDDYDRYLDAGYAAMSSTGASGYGGAITAALFLRRFAGADSNWAHIDVMAWNLSGRPGRPKGGEVMGLRALFDYIDGLARS